MTKEIALALLKASDYTLDEEDECGPLTLNMNDVWGWACSWCEPFLEEDLITLGTLFTLYGWCGLVYWVSTKHNNMKSEFEDINRFVEFVRQEEQVRREWPDSSQRAYKKHRYTLGE